MALKARVESLGRERDLMMTGAWWAVVFDRQKKLKPLGEYLKPATRTSQSSAELLAKFKALGAKGVAVKIEPLHREI